jgi:predicted RNase H-like HicB family nuclease
MKRSMENLYHYRVIFDDNGAGYTVTIPELPGLVTEGHTLKEAREMARDAIRCYLGALLKEIATSATHSAGTRRERISISVA